MTSGFGQQCPVHAIIDLNSLAQPVVIVPGATSVGIGDALVVTEVLVDVGTTVDGNDVGVVKIAGPKTQ
jgi:hypothetical protein